MLYDVVVVIAGCRHPRSMLLAILTMKKRCMVLYLYVCTWFCICTYGVLLRGSSIVSPELRYDPFSAGIVKLTNHIDDCISL